MFGGDECVGLEALRGKDEGGKLAEFTENAEKIVFKNLYPKREIEIQLLTPSIFPGFNPGKYSVS